MTMNILIVEDNPAHVRIYSLELARLIPGARIDVVMSVGGYLRTAADIEYDVCVMDDTICERRSAFLEIAPLIAKKFPKTAILHNSSTTDADKIRNVERLTGVRFARGPDGKVVACNKDIRLIVRFLVEMVVPKDEKKDLPAPRRISITPPMCQQSGSRYPVSGFQPAAAGIQQRLMCHKPF